MLGALRTGRTYTVEEHREHVHVQCDEHTHDDDIDEEMPELIDDNESPTTCREGHTYIYNSPTAPENKASTGSTQPLMYIGYGQRTPPFIQHDSEKSYERDSYYSTTGNY